MTTDAESMTEPTNRTVLPWSSRGSTRPGDPTISSSTSFGPLVTCMAWFNSLKPSARTFTQTLPGSTRDQVNRPSSSVLVQRLAPLILLTKAPGTGRPSALRTCPWTGKPLVKTSTTFVGMPGAAQVPISVAA